MKKLLALLFLSATGCAAGSPDSFPVEAFQPTKPVSVEFPTVEVETCQLKLDVVAPELLGATQKAADRWSTATGCDITLTSDADAIPVRFATSEELVTDEGRNARGVTHREEGEVKFIGYTSSDARLPWTVERTMAHELGHALGCWDHTHEGGASVLDQGYSEGAKITEAALTCVCTVANCTAFQPE